MSGPSDYAWKGFLNHIFGKSAIFTEPTAYCALFTVVGDDSGVGFTEPSGNGYARVSTSAATWNSAAGSNPSSINNAATLTFPTATGTGWGTIIAFGFFDALTTGNLLDWDYIGAWAWLPATISVASPAVVTMPRHGFSANDSVVYSSEYGGPAPTLSQGSLTGLLTVVSPATDTFTLQNGSTALNASATGAGLIRKVSPVAISAGQAPAFAIGNIVAT